MFAPLPDKPDHPALELEILDVWEREGTFERLRERNRGGPAWSFIDGPVTANKTLGVHTAWGRTLKDVFQRYKALRGFDQRYQNGFDCQGLWIEVGVERELGLNSKREIEEYGLEEFARKCRDVVVWSSQELTRGSKRLGQWMDWGNDYFTFSDTNIEYIWHFLKHCFEQGWLYAGHRSTEWCPRCGTSISQHELTGSYVDRADPSLYVRFPLKDRPGESIVVWTTTPWTLPANVAAAVNPDAEYGRRLNGEWVAAPRYPDEQFVETSKGSDMIGWRYVGPFDDLAPGGGVEHRVIPWDEVAMDEGTGIVHIAPGCGGEDFGLEEFARRCRDVVVQSSEALTRGSIRLGQWMDWGNDYFTFSDTNIEYIWHFLKHCFEQGWLYAGHRSTEWCPRCGTSISQHELTGSYVDRADPSLYVRFPLKDRPGESIVVWTTTPWTLPANVAAAVNPEAEYGRRLNGEWVAAPRYPDEQFVETSKGSDMIGWRYVGPFDDLAPGGGVDHRVIPWDEVAMDEGTGIVHIAPGCGGEDFELSRVHDLPVLMPVDEAGRFYDDYGWLHGLSTVEAAEQIIGRLEERGVLVEAGLYEHRYPECWRCHTPLIFRIADDWFISVEELRPRLREANATVEWVPGYFEKRMDDWLQNMGDWNISRRRYYGLPLPIYPCSCGHTTVIGSKAELAERAIEGMDQLEELRRPWVDRVPIRCAQCDEPVTRIPEVGDVWLDAGIVPFSTLGWQNDTYLEEGYATGAARGLTKADLPDSAYWEKWFPADWVSEMREQIRLWFYSQLFMSVALIGRAPFKRVLGYEKMFDETGREMHGSWGNMIQAEDAFAQMGADVMRWQYCQQPPTQDLWFGFAPAHEIKRKLLTFWNSVKFLVDYGNIEKFEPSWSRLEPDVELRPLDRWLVERTKQLVADATAAYEATLTVDVIKAFDAFVDDVSNWYIRRSRRRFYSYDEAAFRTLWYALVQSLRVMSPVMPFLTDHLWRNLVQDGPESVHLAPWPEPGEPDRALLAEIGEVRRVVELGRQARSASRLKLRQPLRRLVVAGASPVAHGHADEIADELRVKEVEFGEVEASELRVKPNLPVLGPKLGAALRDVREQLQRGEFTELDGGRFQVDGHVLEPDEVLVERVGREGWAVASEDGVTVALDTALDDELLLEARLLDRVHEVNVLRKESGFEITDRIKLWLPDDDLLARYRDRLAAETLAVGVESGELRIEKA